jgi:ketosteroid isomerase-like protein
MTAMLTILAALSSSAAAGHCPPASEAQVRGTFERWVRAYEAHDLGGTMSIFDPEVRFEFQGAPDAGWAELKQSYAQDFAHAGGATWTPRWDQLLVSGDVAAAFSLWTGAVRKADGSTEVRAENRSVDVLRRGADCHWRIVRSLTYPLKAPAPAPH